jgi:hypothetical protein
MTVADLLAESMRIGQPVHRAPAPGTSTTLCCGMTALELPATDYWTDDQALVTCQAVPPGAAESAAAADDASDDDTPGWSA